MVIHAFGGYYGLAISWVLYRPNLHQSKRLNGSVYHSDLFAMIGRWPIIDHRCYGLFRHHLQASLASTWTGCVSPPRYAVPVDVLAQFQLSHHGPRWRTAQSGHQHLPRPGLLRSHSGGHLQHVSEERKAGHGRVSPAKHTTHVTSHHL